MALAAGFLLAVVLVTVARFFMETAPFAGLRAAGLTGFSFGAADVEVLAFDPADFVAAGLPVAASTLVVTVREARFGALAGLAAVLARLARRVFGADAAGVLVLAVEAVVLAAGRAVFRLDVFSDFIGQLKMETGEVAPSTRETLSLTPRQRPTERFRHSCAPTRFLGRCRPFQPMP